MFENFCWQLLAVAAEEYSAAVAPIGLHVLVPSRGVTREGTLQVETEPTGEKIVTLTVNGVEIIAELSSDGAIQRVRVPSQDVVAQPEAAISAPNRDARGSIMPAENSIASDESFTIQRPDANLHGTLELPKGVRAQLPVVLIVAGSGPTDRDENNRSGLRTDGYKQLAAALAQAGIASLRYDKRGVGESTFTGNASKLVLADFTEDARAILAALLRDARFSSVSLLGHSEGGLIGLEVTQTTPVESLILVGTPGRTLSVVLREQLSRQISAGDLDAFDSGLDAVRRGARPSALPAALRPLLGDNVLAFLRSALDVDPLPLIATAKAKRIAVVQGNVDLQVSVQQDAAALAAAAPRAVLSVVPGMAHTLKMEKEKSLPQRSYFDPAAPLAQPLVAAVVAAVKGVP